MSRTSFFLLFFIVLILLLIPHNDMGADPLIDEMFRNLRREYEMFEEIQEQSAFPQDAALASLSNATLTQVSEAKKPHLSLQQEFQQIKRELEELEQLKQTLSDNFEQYRRLLEQEKQGMAVGGQLIPILRELIADLQKLENTYTLFEQEKRDQLQKFQQIETHLEQFEENSFADYLLKSDVRKQM